MTAISLSMFDFVAMYFKDMSYHNERGSFLCVTVVLPLFHERTMLETHPQMLVKHVFFFCMTDPVS